MPIEFLTTDISDIQQVMPQAPVQDGNKALSESWLEDSIKLEQMNTLKNMALGNCRLLYGSERFKFYDIVVCEDEDTGRFGAVLTCSQEPMTKVMRTEFADCPVLATRQLIHRLQTDTAKLIMKYGVGSQLRGQQGYTAKDTGNFELANWTRDERIDGPDDDTKGLARTFGNAPDAAPRGPRVDRGVYKRLRMGQIEGRLNYDD